MVQFEAPFHLTVPPLPQYSGVLLTCWRPIMTAVNGVVRSALRSDISGTLLRCFINLLTPHNDYCHESSIFDLTLQPLPIQWCFINLLTPHNDCCSGCRIWSALPSDISGTALQCFIDFLIPHNDYCQERSMKHPSIWQYRHYRNTMVFY